MKDSKKKMNGSLDTLKVDFGDRLAKLEMQYTTQQTALRKLTTEAGDKFAQLTTELREEITKSRERERTISEELEELVVQQDDFMRTTRSRLYELAELEENSSSVLEQIQKNDEKNSAKVKFIENYEKQTEDRLKGHESEIRMLTKMINSLQNKLNVEDFKEDKINEQLRMYNRETMKKIDSLKSEMEYIVAQQSPKMDDDVKLELSSLEEELRHIEGFVMIQQFDMDRINQKNKSAIGELKMTDFKLQDKLTNVEKNVRRIGTDILVRTKMLFPAHH